MCEYVPRKPLRPNIPFLALPAIALWLALRVAQQIAWEAYSVDGAVNWLSSAVEISQFAAAWLLIVVCCLAAVGVAIAATIIICKRMRLAGAMVTGKHMILQMPMPTAIAGAACLGFIVGMLCWGSLCMHLDNMNNAKGPYEVCVTSDVVQSTYGAYSEGRLTIAEGTTLNVRVMWDSSEQALPLGMKFESSGRVTAISRAAKSQSMFQNLVGCRFYPTSISAQEWDASAQGMFGCIREGVVQELRQFSGDGELLLEGVVLGNRSRISDTQLYDAFRLTGLAHLLAVSGSHLAVVSVLLAWAMSALRLPRWLRIGAMALMVIGYLVLTGMQPSAFRACIMVVAAGASWFVGRRANSLSGLTIAVIALLIINPSNAFSVGFMLSVLGVAGLCLFIRLTSYWLQQLLPSKGRSIAQPMAMTLTAQASTMPVSLPMFGMLSLVGPLCNIIVSPVVAVLLGGGLVAMPLLMLMPALGQLVLAALCALGDVLCAFVKLMAQIPHAAISAYLPSWLAWAVFIACVVVLWVKWPLPSRDFARKILGWVAASAFVLALVFGRNSGTQIVVMDVGQGDSILVRSGTSQVLIDTGQYDSSLQRALGRNGVYDLDALVITHMDSDHCGAIDALQTTVSVDRVVLASGTSECAKEDQTTSQTLASAYRLVGENNVVEMSHGQSMRLSDQLSMTMVWPDEPIKEQGNAVSLCLLLQYDYDLDGSIDFQMLLTGDAEKDQLQQIVSDGLGDINVLKVGHHGSKVAVDDATITTLNPEAALISVGAGNSYGHPSQVILQVLQNHGVQVYRTDKCGDITVQLQQGSYAVWCANIYP